MSSRQTFKTIIFLIVFGILGLGYFLYQQVNKTFEDELYQMGSDSNSPTSIFMYHLLEKKSKEYDIPKQILYNVAYLETRYQGPFHWRYDHRQISSAGAQGPMQIITRWAHSYAERRVSEKELRNNIDLNVRVSMKMLRARYEMTRDWMLACGGYNTGSPVRNSYAVFAATNKNYKNNWIKY